MSNGNADKYLSMIRRIKSKGIKMETITCGKCNHEFIFNGLTFETYKSCETIFTQENKVIRGGWCCCDFGYLCDDCVNWKVKKRPIDGWAGTVTARCDECYSKLTNEDKYIMPK